MQRFLAGVLYGPRLGDWVCDIAWIIDRRRTKELWEGLGFDDVFDEGAKAQAQKSPS